MIVSASYLHLVLAGRTALGEDFCLVAGRHDEGYPLGGPAFDAVMLVAGPRRLQASAPRLHGLQLPPPTAGADRELALALELSPPPSPGARSAGLVMVEASIDLRIGIPVPLELGFRHALGSLPGPLPGMTYRAAVIDASPGSCPWIQLDGAPIPLLPHALLGEIEWGHLVNLDFRDFRCGYDYLCAVELASDRVLVDVRSHSLYADGWLSRTVDLVADATASVRLIGHRARRPPSPAPDEVPQAAPHGLRRAGRLLEARIPLGAAAALRAVARFTDASGRDYLGLAESIVPCGPAAADAAE
jgi:hypothetical protein